MIPFDATAYTNQRFYGKTIDTYLSLEVKIIILLAAFYNKSGCFKKTKGVCIFYKNGSSLPLKER